MDDERTIGETPQGARRRLACRGTGGGRPATRGGPAVQPERRAAGGSAGAGSGATCRRRRRHPELVWRARTASVGRGGHLLGGLLRRRRLAGPPRVEHEEGVDAVQHHRQVAEELPAQTQTRGG